MATKDAFLSTVQFEPARKWLRDFLVRKSGAVFCLIDQKVDQLYQITQDLDGPFYTIEADEKRKTIETAVEIWESMSSFPVDRDFHLVAIGGGIVTDIGGFIASTYMRGLPLTHIPTTLLGMVDASLGGKTGLNLLHWKNRIGSFYSADQIIIDRSFLQTLPDSEWQNGWAEVFKHALIKGGTLAEKIRAVRTVKEARDVIDDDLLINIMQVKEEMVKLDLQDRGERQKLNVGHTVGHALETYFLTRGKSIHHGRAVAAGLWIEAQISFLEELLLASTKKEIQNYIENSFDLPRFSVRDVDLIYDKMKGDKKNKNRSIHFSLIGGWGRVCINQTPGYMTVKDAIRSYCITIENS